MKTPQVRLTITTDYLYTAEFLYELAAQIENEGVFENLETAHGYAELEWPEEAYEDEAEDDQDMPENEKTPLDERIRKTLMVAGNIDDAETALSLFGTPRFVDEKIDDGCDDDEDEYVMMQSYEVAGYYVRIYYGNNTGKIGDVDVRER